mgnify:CR=1 FL=1
MQGLVIKSTGSWYQVYAEDGDKVECRLKGKFRMKGIKSTNPVAVGSMTFVDASDTAIVNKSANAGGILAATPTFVRIKQTAGNGSCSMTIVQFGNATY